MHNSESISIAMKGGLFNFRVAGIAINKGKVLLHKTEEDEFWSFPGGRVEMFEFSRETLLREMMEETGLLVEVGNLSRIVENFFEYNNIRHHELGLYYQMKFVSLINQDDFTCRDGDNELLFRWFNLTDIHLLKIYPEGIILELLSDTESISHLTIAFQNLHQ